MIRAAHHIFARALAKRSVFALGALVFIASAVPAAAQTPPPLGTTTQTTAQIHGEALHPSTLAPARPQQTIGAALLPRDLSPLKMFLAADAVVKGVMIGLLFASLMTWTVGLVKSIELFSAKRRLRANLRAIFEARSLREASLKANNKSSVFNGLLAAATGELKLSFDAPDKAGIKERTELRLERLQVAAVRAINQGTGVVATIGSTAPFVGLFGTVWGIMNSFIGISQAQTTNLAVVAPGIAEALLATALGLVAAIPAVIIYNLFARSVAGYKAIVGDAAIEVMRLMSRDLDRLEHTGARLPLAAE